MNLRQQIKNSSLLNNLLQESEELENINIPTPIDRHSSAIPFITTNVLQPHTIVAESQGDVLPIVPQFYLVADLLL